MEHGVGFRANNDQHTRLYEIKRAPKKSLVGGNLPMASVIIGLKIVLYRRFPMGYQSLSGMIKGGRNSKTTLLL